MYLLELKEFVALLLGSSELLNHLEGGVKVEPTEAVSQVEQVHSRLALEIVDVEGEAGALHVFGGEFSLNDLNEWIEMIKDLYFDTFDKCLNQKLLKFAKGWALGSTIF